MKALLLAAGLGTRLRPITDTIPKCLVEINGMPLLKIWLDTLFSSGIETVLINTHHLHKKVDKFIATLPQHFQEKITVVYESELLGTGGTLLSNKSFFNQTEPFLVIHADNYSICDYKHFIQSYATKPKTTIMCMMTFTTDTPSSCGIVNLNENNIVKEFYEKVQNPPSNLANGAVYIFDYGIFTLLESLQKKNIDISTEIIPKLIGKIWTYHNNHIHIDIGTIKNLQMAQGIINV